MDVLYKISGDKEGRMLAEIRGKAIMDEQSRLDGTKKEGVKEIILDNLSNLGNVPKKLIDIINKQDNMKMLKI